jgi:hypothetical protein
MVGFQNGIKAPRSCCSSTGSTVGRQSESLLGPKHHPAVGRDPVAIEGGSDLLARDRWLVEEHRGILGHGEFVTPQSCRFRLGKNMSYIHGLGDRADPVHQ